mmetsp:Transcript_1985/g.2840  ORF Transcript_1985/g.2840 Transcript_1985/m.2840 type:complete len:384 (+) Transcript_1985:334-1485(+)
MATNWQRRVEKVKGHTSYHPNQMFSLNVQWVVTNENAAKELLAGLKKCAAATRRDTPCTPFYFFRISHDQSLAEEMKQSVKTLGDHPHYKKAFKTISMGIPIETAKLRLERDGMISSLLDLGADEPIGGHIEELSFNPVVVDLSEVYLDSRAFFEHAESKDYMEGYGELMKPSLSLAPFTIVLGTPEQSIRDSIIEPVLKAKSQKEYPPFNFGVVFLPPPKSVELNECTKVLYDLSVNLTNDLDSVSDTDLWKSCRAAIDSVLYLVSANISIVMPTSARSIRLIFSHVWNGNKDIISELVQSLQNLIQGNDLVAGISGQLFAFVHNGEKGEIDIIRKLWTPTFSDIQIRDAQLEEAENRCAGYVLHPLSASLNEDSTVEYVKV